MPRSHHTVSLTLRELQALTSACVSQEAQHQEMSSHPNLELRSSNLEMADRLSLLREHLQVDARRATSGVIVRLSEDEAHRLHYLLAFRYEEIDQRLGEHGWTHRTLERLSRSLGIDSADVE